MASENIQHVTDSSFDQLVKSRDSGSRRFLGGVVHALPADRADGRRSWPPTTAGKLVVAKMNVDENPDVPMRLGIRGIPTLMLFKGGEMVDTVVGPVDKDTIKQMVDRHL